MQNSASISLNRQCNHESAKEHMGTYYPSHNYGPEHAATLADGTYMEALERDPLHDRREPKRKISEKQLAANRANAQKSTGPRTEAGKARSSVNAFRNGLTGHVSALTEEDRQAEARFTAPLIADLNAKGALENQLAQAIAQGHWRLNRIRAMEDNIFAVDHFGPADPFDAGQPELQAALTSAQVYLRFSREFDRLTIYEQRIQRGIEKNMRELEALQAKRTPEQPRAAKPERTAPQPKAGPPQNGFEFSTAPVTAKAAHTDTIANAITGLPPCNIRRRSAAA